MRFSIIAKRVLFLTCAINTVLILAITAAANFTPSLQKVPFRFTNILFILLFSFVIGLISLVLYADRLSILIRLLIHYAALTLSLFLFVVLIGGFAGESGARSSVIFLAFIVYTVIYAVIAITVCAIRRKANKPKKDNDEHYESQF